MGKILKFPSLEQYLAGLKSSGGLWEYEPGKFQIKHLEVEKLAISTMIGSGYYIENSEMSLSDMQAAVASPGGTTEAALKILEENNWQQLIEKAINGAFVRANELSEE